MKKEDFGIFKSFIEKYKRFLIVGHIDPDGDCISSILSLVYGLRRLEKEVIAAVDSRCPSIFDTFCPAEQIDFERDISEDEMDAIIVVDSSSIDRMGKYEKLRFLKPTLVIDHHATNNYWGDFNCVDVSAAAATQIIYWFLKELGVEFDPVLATISLLGIQTDTGFFKYTNTTSQVMKDAGELVEAGAEPYFNASLVTENNRVEEFYILSDMADHIKVELDGKLIYSHISLENMKKNNCTPEDATGLIGELRSIKGVETAILFTEVGEKDIKISFRSKKWFDVAKIAIELHGGGHQRASGCSIYDTLDNALELVINKVKDEMEIELNQMNS
jgi:phosphoesterase RecJ-like protein